MFHLGFRSICWVSPHSTDINIQWNNLFSLWVLAFLSKDEVMSCVFDRQVKEDNSAKHAGYAGSETSTHAQASSYFFFLFVDLTGSVRIAIIIDRTWWRSADLRTDLYLNIQHLFVYFETVESDPDLEYYISVNDNISENPENTTMWAHRETYRKRLMTFPELKGTVHPKIFERMFANKLGHYRLIKSQWCPTTGFPHSSNYLCSTEQGNVLE